LPWCPPDFEPDLRLRRARASQLVGAEGGAAAVEL